MHREPYGMLTAAVRQPAIAAVDEREMLARERRLSQQRRAAALPAGGGACSAQEREAEKPGRPRSVAHCGSLLKSRFYSSLWPSAAVSRRGAASQAAPAER